MSKYIGVNISKKERERECVFLDYGFVQTSPFAESAYVTYAIWAYECLQRGKLESIGEILGKYVRI